MLRALFLIALAAPTVSLAGPAVPVVVEGGTPGIAEAPSAPRARVVHLGEPLRVTRRIRTEAARVHLARADREAGAEVTVVRGYGATEPADPGAAPEIWQALANLCRPAPESDPRLAVPVRLDF